MHVLTGPFHKTRALGITRLATCRYRDIIDKSYTRYIYEGS